MDGLLFSFEVVIPSVEQYMQGKNLFFILISTLNLCFSYGQEAIEAPQHFGQFYNNPMLNICRNGMESIMSITLGDQRNVGGFAGVSTSYFNANFQFSNKKGDNRTTKNGKNILGVYVYSDNEGDFIFRRRALISYSRHQKISKKLHLAVGLSSGFYFYGINPSTSTGGYSAYSYEGNASLLLYSKNTQLGLSVNQFSDNTIQPVSQIMRLRRHYYLFGEHTIKINDYSSMISSGYLRYTNLNSTILTQREINTGISHKVIMNIVMFGVNIDLDAFYGIVGLANLEIENHSINIDFSYKVPIRNNNININQLELNLRYFINEKKKVTI